ncbi:LANO_0E06392g1_1 [Lachancea nothofagi CBS 11611]|uniref:Exocyst complex component Sec8 n=1 Tax=Lachancea nothofagi CBS 11611 TaxID=1266666 RepID=A0A1G4JTS5_9SACH|nr:LANO_0E06392g1_1 [Lachancea nothofagi CBS 11611]
MSHLGVPAQRKRALSVNNATHTEKAAMDSALDSLQNDLTLISSQWNKVIIAGANPLELALAFLDDTSVGLGYRHNEFKHLSSRLAHDLQQAVNEHYQAFNTNIASYEQTVELISESQGHIRDIKENIVGSTTNMRGTQTDLEKLNESCQDINAMLEVLDAVDQLLAVPDVVDDLIRQKSYFQAKEALVKGFSSASTFDLWKIPALRTTRQILESQKHTLYETLIEDISDIVYSKRLNVSPRYEIRAPQLNDGSYSNMESYLSNTVDLDIEEQSVAVNSGLNKFLKQLGLRASQLKEPHLYSSSRESTYEKIFDMLSILNDMDELHVALVGISGRAKEEIHNVITQATEAMRVKHPSLIKLTVSLEGESEFGIPGQDALSLFLRNVFWEIFSKLLLALQGHRVIYEVSQALQSSSVIGEKYKFDEIWDKTLDEVRLLLQNYTKDTKLRDLPKSKLSKIEASNNENELRKPLGFLLQNNVDDDSSTRNHANDLKDLLKEMFPGFSASANLELKSIYLEEEAFEQEETLVPPKIFNMAFILESLLLFVQGSTGLLPASFFEKSISPLNFFNEFMGNDFLPQFELTVTHLFKTNVEASNPYLLESQSDSHPIFKPAFDFKNLFCKILCLFNTTYTYRAKVVSVILKLLDRFYSYYQKILSKLLGSVVNTRLDKKIISKWNENAELREITNKIFEGDTSCFEEETNELLKACPNFFLKGQNLKKQELFNNLTLETVASFLNTIKDIKLWLANLRKVSSNADFDNRNGSLGANTLKEEWSLFEVPGGEALVNSHSLKLLLNSESAQKLDRLLDNFQAMENKLWASLRYDIRARSIYYVTQFLQDSLWCPEVASVELDHNISTLTAELNTLESRLKESITPRQKELVFEGLSGFLSEVLILGSRCVVAYNHNGAKKMIKNINILQHACRSFASSPQSVNMSMALEYFNLCADTEMTVVQRANAGELQKFSIEDIKNILRLQLSEELQRQMKRESGMGRAPSMSANKRLSDAVGRLQLTRRNE